jgi:Na+-transporting NADH:ubiquinone oxidoreductase subunit NqrC
VLFVLFVVVCVLCMIVSNTYSVVLFVLFVVVLCLVYGCVNNTTLYVLDTTMHKTQDDDKQDK